MKKEKDEEKEIRTPFYRSIRRVIEFSSEHILQNAGHTDRAVLPAPICQYTKC